MLELIYTSNKAVAIEDADLNSAQIYYLRAWDAMIFHIPVKGVYKLFRDGSQVLIIPWPDYINLTGRVNGRHCWLYSYGLSDKSFWPADEISGNYHPQNKLNEAWVTPVADAIHSGNYLDDIRHIAVWFTLDTLHFVNLSTGAEIGTLNLGIDPDTIKQIAWAGEGKIVVTSNDSGRVFLIDYLSRTIVLQSKVAPCKAAAYDCIHNLVITLGSDKLIRLYTLDVVPAILSSPVFVPAGDQHLYVGSKVRTRLTGDIGEPCKDYWIHWSLLGALPKGSLLRDRSRTDADGYAENYYFGPRIERLAAADETVTCDPPSPMIPSGWGFYAYLAHDHVVPGTLSGRYVSEALEELFTFTDDGAGHLIISRPQSYGSINYETGVMDITIMDPTLPMPDIRHLPTLYASYDYEVIDEVTGAETLRASVKVA
jgi:hypothetical protein